MKKEENATGSRSSRNEGGNQVSIHSPILGVSLATCLLFSHSVALKEKTTDTANDGQLKIK